MVVEIYTDGACSGNPGHNAPEAAKPRGRFGSCSFAASSRNKAGPGEDKGLWL